LLDLDRDARNVARTGDQLKVAALRCPRFRIVHCERAQNFSIFRNERFGPGCDEAVAEGQVASVVWPARESLEIFGTITRRLVNAAAPQEALSGPIRQGDRFSQAHHARPWSRAQKRIPSCWELDDSETIRSQNSRIGDTGSTLRSGRTIISPTSTLAGCLIANAIALSRLAKSSILHCGHSLTQLRLQGIHLHWLRRAFPCPISRCSANVRNNTL
jgi:hypothetical protein